MTFVEIGFLGVGIICFVVSFFISEKLSSSDIKEFEKMSKTEMNVIVEKQLRNADDGIRGMIEEGMRDAMEDFDARADKILNNKIIGISDYSDSVIESIKKSHNEIVFMYDMLIEKQEKLKSLTDEIETLEKNLLEIKSNVTEITESNDFERVLEVLDTIPEIDISELNRDIPLDEAIIKEAESSGGSISDSDINKKIVSMYREGQSEVDIAKNLGKGLGEVKLVLGLFNRE